MECSERSLKPLNCSGLWSTHGPQDRPGACRRWYERLAQRRTLLGYDVRDTGLSEREVIDFSLEARVLDLEAVLDHLNLDRFNLLGATLQWMKNKTGVKIAVRTLYVQQRLDNYVAAATP